MYFSYTLYDKNALEVPKKTPNWLWRCFLVSTKTCSLLSFVQSIYNPTYRCQWCMQITRGNAIGRYINWREMHACDVWAKYWMGFINACGYFKHHYLNPFSLTFFEVARGAPITRDLAWHTRLYAFHCIQGLSCKCPSGSFWALTLNIPSLWKGCFECVSHNVVCGIFMD